MLVVVSGSKPLRMIFISSLGYLGEGRIYPSLFDAPAGVAAESLLAYSQRYISDVVIYPFDFH